MRCLTLSPRFVISVLNDYRSLLARALAQGFWRPVVLLALRRSWAQKSWNGPSKKLSDDYRRSVPLTRRDWDIFLHGTAPSMRAENYIRELPTPRPVRHGRRKSGRGRDCRRSRRSLDSRRKWRNGANSTRLCAMRPGKSSLLRRDSWKEISCHERRASKGGTR